MDYTFSVTAKTRALNVPATYTAGTRPDMPNKQIDLSKGPYYFSTPTLPGVNDANFFEFTVPMGGAGTLYVVTAPNDPAKDMTNVTLDVLEGTCKAPVRSVINGPIDNDVYEMAAFSTQSGKTYCVAIGISPFGGAGGPYTLLLTPDL